jgi:hypothetical protein
MTYGSGDSFGSSSGNIEILWVFKDANVALAAQQHWEKACNIADNSLSYKDKESVTFLDDNNNEIKLSNPSAGYFETTEYITLTTFLVNP